MNCKYSYQGEQEADGRHYLICKNSNERCHAVRYCPDVRDIINTDGYKNGCNIYINNESNIGYSIDTPNKVVIAKGDKLWVKHEQLDQVFIVQNPLNYVPKFVKLEKNTDGDYYIVH